MQLSFLCEFHGYDLCFFGGICQKSISGEEFCLCPVGFGHAFIPLHSSNCDLPQNALPVFSKVFAVVWLLVFIYFHLKRTKSAPTPQLQTLANYTVLYHLALGTLVLCYYLEGGLFLYTAISSVFFYSLNGIVLTKILSLTLEIMHPHYANQFKPRIQRVEYFFWASNLCVGLPISWLMRKELALENTTADLLISFSGFCSSISIALLGVYFWQTANKLIRMIEKSAKLLPNTNAPKVISRIRTVKRMLVLNSNMMGFAICLILLLRFTLGSVPFLWVLLFLGEMCGNLIPLGVSVFFDKATNGTKSVVPRPKNSVISTNIRPSGRISELASGESGVLLSPSSFDF